MPEEDKNLPCLCWTPELHKVPFSIDLLLTPVNVPHIRYCNTETSLKGVNSMWIVKDSTSLLSSLNQLDVCAATSVQTYDFSTLYTSIPHNLLKSLHLYTTHSRREMEVTGIPTLKLQVAMEKGIS